MKHIRSETGIYQIYDKNNKMKIKTIFQFVFVFLLKDTFIKRYIKT